MNGKVTWKWLAIVLAGLCVGMLGWFANGVWSAQEATETLNSEQQVDIKILNMHIESIDKSLLDLEHLMYKRGGRDHYRDSVLQDVAFKVNMMFEGR